MFNEIEDLSQHPVFKVLGIGGGGGNAVDRMIENAIEGVEFVAINTDAQNLKESKAPTRILIGKNTTGGLGAGAHPEIGRAAAIESEEEIREAIYGANLVFITAGLGGGTGSGAAPVIARIAKDMNCLTVGVVTRPFSFEGKERSVAAFEAINEIKKFVDTLIVIPNDRLLNVFPHASYLESFRNADKVLRQCVQGISEVIFSNGVINLDFADLRTTIENKGTALMGIGAARGENRAKEAAQAAIKSPLLETSINGATHAILNITSGSNLSLTEIKEIMDEVQSASSTTINFIWGCQYNPNLGDEVIVTIIATGFSTDPLSNLSIRDVEGTAEEELHLFNEKEKKGKKAKKVKGKKLPSWLE